MRLRKFINKLSDLVTTAMLNPKDFGDVEVISELIGQAYMVNPAVAGGEFIVTVDKNSGRYTVEVPKPGHRAAIIPNDAQQIAFVGDEDVSAPFPPMTLSRIAEFLDYASCYGDYDENTPNGTPASADAGHGMNDYRRAAIVLLKKVLGFLPQDTKDAIVFPDHGYRVGQLEIALREAADQLRYYRDQHRAKGTPEAEDKARVNEALADRYYRLLGEDVHPEPVDYALGLFPVADDRQSFSYVIETFIENGYERGVPASDMAGVLAEQAEQIMGCASVTESPVSDDSAVPGPETPAKLSSDPLDRAAVVLLIREKSKVARGRNLAEIANTLDALADEIAQHMEEQPIDVARALREFYVDCHARNVKAGWWNDLSNGEPKKRSVGELFMLFVTEIAEAYDAYARGNIADDKLPQYPGLGVEIADLQIRLGDFCGALLAGSIVEHSGTFNPGDEMFKEVAAIAARYEAIRKTPEAKGATEMGEPLEPMDVAVMVIDKLAFNAQRADHKPENRMKEGGKQT